MSDAGDAVRRHRALLSQQTEEYEKWLDTVTKLRLPWREGHEKLYKFKSLRGGSKKHVVDIFRNSRIYFSTPDEFNDPLDCAPVFKLPRDPPDQALIEELQEHERAAFADAGKSPKQIARLRKYKGVDIRRFAAAVTRDVRNKLQAATFIYCLSADQEHPLLWSHYADSHKGVCLHFQSTHGTLFGGARAVEYSGERKPVLVPLEYNKSNDDITDAMSRTKAEFWRYESEYRIIEFGREARLCPFGRRLLCGITLGMQISTRDRKLMLSLAAAHHPVVPVYRAEEDTEKFWMRIWRIA